MVGRIRKHCPRHPTVSVFTTGFLFLGALAELRKATITFVVSVRPFVPVEQLVFHGLGFHEILFEHFSKICLKSRLIIKI
jgi:hypothetical protein